MTTVEPTLIVASSKQVLPKHLNAAILKIASEAIKARGVFTIALSGGSLASFLSDLEEAFDKINIDPLWHCWHVILADERCVLSTNPDSNLGALKPEFLSLVPIPENQIHGINESKLQESTENIAEDYELVVKQVLSLSGGQLDLAVLGFGPDGHTCSLFPDHPLLKEKTKWVAPIENSPKPPPMRITLTFAVLNEHTRHVVFCGAGGSKAPILRDVFTSVGQPDPGYLVGDGSRHNVTIKTPPPYPCAMVRPNVPGDESSLIWVVDKDAVKDVSIPE